MLDSRGRSRPGRLPSVARFTPLPLRRMREPRRNSTVLRRLIVEAISKALWYRVRRGGRV